MKIVHRKNKGTLYSSTQFYSEGCPSGYSGPAVTRSATAESYVSQQDADDIALTIATALVKQQLLTGCILTPTGSAEPLWVPDTRTKRCSMVTHPRNMARSEVKMYDSNPLSPTYHNNLPLEQVTYQNNGAYFPYLDNDESCPIDISNVTISKIFTRSNCGNDAQGNKVAVTVPASSFYVPVTTPDAVTVANAKAQKYIDDYGQKIVNGDYVSSSNPAFENGDSSINTPGICTIYVQQDTIELYAAYNGQGQAIVRATRTKAQAHSVTVEVHLEGDNATLTIMSVTIPSSSLSAETQRPIQPRIRYQAKIVSISNPNYTSGYAAPVQGTPY